MLNVVSGVRRNFPRGRYSKKILKLLWTFFLGRPIGFSELSENTKRILFCPIFSAAQASFLKNRPKKRSFWAFFGKFWQKMRFFFGARSSLKFSYFGIKDAFRKILSIVSQKWMS